VLSHSLGQFRSFASQKLGAIRTLEANLDATFALQ